jgi:hypothetical protein
LTSAADTAVAEFGSSLAVIVLMLTANTVTHVHHNQLACRPGFVLLNGKVPHDDFAMQLQSSRAF